MAPSRCRIWNIIKDFSYLLPVPKTLHAALDKVFPYVGSIQWRNCLRWSVDHGMGDAISSKAVPELHNDIKGTHHCYHTILLIGKDPDTSMLQNMQASRVSAGYPKAWIGSPRPGWAAEPCCRIRTLGQASSGSVNNTEAWLSIQGFFQAPEDMETSIGWLKNLEAWSNILGGSDIQQLF